MTETNKVVVHYLNGTILKGSTQDFAPNRPQFHLIPLDTEDTIKIKASELKAVYFVKDFTGSPGRRDIDGFNIPGTVVQGKKIAVTFPDGELLCGTTLSYTPGRAGFFLLPIDPGSNNLRIYVISTSATEVKAGPAAEVLARKAS